MNNIKYVSYTVEILRKNREVVCSTQGLLYLQYLKCRTWVELEDYLRVSAIKAFKEREGQSDEDFAVVAEIVRLTVLPDYPTFD